MVRVISPTLPSGAPIACLPGSGRLHSTPATILCVPLRQPGCTFTNNLSEALFMMSILSLLASLLPSWACNCYWGCTVTSGLSWRLTVPRWAVFLDPFMSLKSVPSEWRLHTVKFSYQHGCLWNRGSLCSQKILPIFHFSAAILLLNATDFLAPADQGSQQSKVFFL